ncbi:MAG: protein-export chaperone SecB [Pseudomonadota bacterium]|jgi:preprotein translocase subunit SecB
MSEQQEQPFFGIEKIYVKDLSLEIPNAPQVFLQRETPEIHVDLNTKGVQLEEGVYESTLIITVTATAGEKTLFLVEVEQAGIFQIRNVPPSDVEQVLRVACPNILYPFIREVVSDMTVRAGFSPVILNPMNFEALYHEQEAAKAQQSEAVTH